MELSEQKQEKPVAKPKRAEIEKIQEPKEILTAKGGTPSPTKTAPKPVIAPKKAVLSEIAVAPVNFAPYQQQTHLRFKTNFSSYDRPSIVFNQNPFINDIQERKLGKVTTGRSYVTFNTDLSLIHI